MQFVDGNVVVIDKDGGSKNLGVVQKGWQRIELIQGFRFYGSSGGKKYPASLVCSTLWFSHREAVLIILMVAVSTMIIHFFINVLFKNS